MATYTKKEFAALCGMEQRAMMAYASGKRKTKIVIQNDCIDTANPSNATFLAKYSTVKPAKTTLSYAPTIDSEDAEETSILDLLKDAERGSLPQTELDRIYKYLQGKKIEKDIEKTNLDIEKKRGEVVPSELIKPVFLQHNQFIITEFKNAMDEVIRIISKRKSLTVNEIADIRGELVPCINTAMDKATTSSVKNIANLIADFSDKRGVGERT